MTTLRLTLIVSIYALGSLVSATKSSPETAQSDVGNQESCSALCASIGDVYNTEETEDAPAACDNFYRHICHRNQPKDTGTQENREATKVTEEALREKLFAKIRGLLEDTAAEQRALVVDQESLTVPKRDIRSMAKKLYKVCTEDKDKTSDADVKIALLEMLKSFGIDNWPLRSERERNATDILTKTGLRTLATIDVVPDVKQPVYALTMNVPMSRFEPHKKTWFTPASQKKIEAYTEFLRSVLHLFRELQDNSHMASKTPLQKSRVSKKSDERHGRWANIVSEILDVEKNITWMIEEAGKDNNPVTLTVKDWQEKFGEQFPFEAGLKRDFDKAGVFISNETKVTIRLLKYFEKLVPYLGTLKRKTLVNYLGWTLIREASDVLTKNIRENLNKFLDLAPKPKIAVELNSHSCIEKFIGYRPLMHNGIAYLYINAFFNGTFMKEAYDIAVSLNSSFYNVIEKNSWMDSSSRKNASKWIQNVLYHMGAPEYLIHEESIKREYDLVPVNGSEHLALLVFFYRNNNFLQKLRLTNQTYDHKKVWRESPFGVRGKYLEHYTAVEMPAAALQEPVFTLGALASHNFGSTGSLTGEVIAQGFRDEGHGWRYKTGDYEWTEHTRKQFRKVIQCLKKEKEVKRQGRNSGDGGRKRGQKPKRDAQQHFEEDGSDATLALKLRDHLGLRSSFNAFRELLSTCSLQCRKPQDDVHAHHFKNFFASYAKRHCGSDVTDETEHRVNFALKTYEEFWTAIKCTTGEKMKGEDKCRIMSGAVEKDTSSP